MTMIAVLAALLTLIWLIPLREMIPARDLQRTLHIILSRRYNKSFISASSAILKLQRPLNLFIRIFNINGQSDRWRRYSAMLKTANVESILNVEQFVAMKFLVSSAAISYFVLISLVKLSGAFILLGAALSLITFYLPDQWLKLQGSKRKLQIQKEIPSVLISLAVTTDAGLSLIQALEEVCHTKKGELSEEIRKTLMEISIGISQKEAFRNLSNRVNVQELTLFVSVLTQTLEKGASGITSVLRDQANSAWLKRKNKAKELGEKASIKLFFPLVLFIFPALMIFLISPAVFSIVKFFVN